MESSSRDKWSLLLSLAIAIVVPLLVLFAVPVWIGMLSMVQDVWPTQTRLLFSGYKFSLLYPAAVAGLWFIWPRTNRRAFVVPVVALVGAVLILAVSWWAGTDQDTVPEAIRRASEVH